MEPERQFAAIRALMQASEERACRMELRFNQRMDRADQRATAADKRAIAADKRAIAADKRMDKFEKNFQARMAKADQRMEKQEQRMEYFPCLRSGSFPHYEPDLRHQHADSASA